MVIIVAPPDERLSKMGLNQENGKRDTNGNYIFEMSEDEFASMKKKYNLRLEHNDIEGVKWYDVMQGPQAMASYFSSKEEHVRFNNDTMHWW